MEKEIDRLKSKKEKDLDSYERIWRFLDTAKEETDVILNRHPGAYAPGDISDIISKIIDPILEARRVVADIIMKHKQEIKE